MVCRSSFSRIPIGEAKELFFWGATVTTLLLLLPLYGAVVRNPNEGMTVGPENGWLIIQGGGSVTNEVKERFVALAGGANGNFVLIPTAMSDEQIAAGGFFQGQGAGWAKSWGISHVTMLHTRDRARANSEYFVEALRGASGVWIMGGRQWRLADAYLDTAVEREIKALLGRGGVVGGGSAGATIQGSFLVRGAPGTALNPDGDNRKMMVPGHERGFGLVANSAIDQHINTRGRERDLDSVIAVHPELLGIGIDETAAIVVHGDSFFVVGGQVAVHDGSNHNGAGYYFLAPGEAFNLRTRKVDASDLMENKEKYPLTLTVNSATRSRFNAGIKTVGSGLLNSKGTTDEQSRQINFECNVSLYSVGANRYPARRGRPNEIGILAREVDTDKVTEFVCKY